MVNTLAPGTKVLWGDKGEGTVMDRKAFVDDPRQSYANRAWVADAGECQILINTGIREIPHYTELKLMPLAALVY